MMSITVEDGDYGLILFIVCRGKSAHFRYSEAKRDLKKTGLLHIRVCVCTSLKFIFLI